MMLQTSTGLGFLVAHGMQRIGHAPILAARSAMGHLASLPYAVALATGRERRAAGAAGRLVRVIRDVYALARHGEAAAPVVRGGASEADLVEARLLADQWRSRAEDGERRIAELEVQLAASEMTALELRSRVVCLHGKLATSTATVRYQSLTLALESQHPETLAGGPQQI